MGPSLGLSRFIGYMGSSQDLGPILVPLNFRCRNTISEKGPMILRTTHTLAIQGPQVQSLCQPWNLKTVVANLERFPSGTRGMLISTV